MKPSNLFALALAIAAVTAGCGTTKQQQGQVIGSVAGAVLGSQVGGGTARLAATIAGTMMGGFIGGNIGREMDQKDHQKAGNALEKMPTNTTSTWENPDNGNRYAVTPTRTYYADELPCREYTTQAWMDGQQETVHGTACRQTNGNWEASN